MDASNIPKGQSPEHNGGGRRANRRGVYKHPENGEEFIATSVASADAFARAGFEFIGSATTNVGGDHFAAIENKSEPETKTPAPKAEDTDEVEALKKKLANAESKAKEESDARKAAEKELKAATKKNSDTPKEPETKTPAPTETAEEKKARADQLAKQQSKKDEEEK